MRFSSSFVSLILALPAFSQSSTSSSYTWPDPATDELEDVAYVQTGYNSRGLGYFIETCEGNTTTTGHQTAAEWIQVPFHDAITHNATAGVGGADASLMWETNRPENVGTDMNGTYETFMNFYTERTPLADLTAVGAHSAMRRCGGPLLPIYAGRVDATEQGPCCGPKPVLTLDQLQAIFNNAGFTNDEMIGLTACGHTVGGVRSQDFPGITGNTNNNSITVFDATNAIFDNMVVQQYVNNIDNPTGDQNPLVGGPLNTTSDLRVFGSNNTYMEAMLDETFFEANCLALFTRLYTLVPTGVTLSAPIFAREVKPYELFLTINSDESLQFTGSIRLRMTDRGTSAQTVQLEVTDRNGHAAGTISTTLGGTAYGLDDTFNYYNFNAKLTNGISKFNVLVTPASPARAATQIYNNNGGGYPVQDIARVQLASSCLTAPNAANSSTLTVTAAVRNDHVASSSTVTLRVVTKTPQQGAVAPALGSTTFPLHEVSRGSEYTIFQTEYEADAYQFWTTFDVITSAATDSFINTKLLSTTCA